MKTKIIALFCACFLLLTATDVLVPRTEAKIFDSVIRLHILAEDNSDNAQRIKLLVRDAVLAECPHLFSETGDVIAASESVISSLPQMEAVANRVLAECGVDYKAKAEWGYEEYPTRVYENLTLPAGKYRSLRLVLGDGKGNNWWCVLFPPLCTKASTEPKDFSSTDVNENDSSVFTDKKYVFRFKLLELFR